METEVMETEAVEAVDTAPSATEHSDENAPPAEADTTLDYAEMAREDLQVICALRPEYASCKHLSELPFAQRFAKLRELGLSAEEALGAVDRAAPRGGKEHLRTVSPRAASERGQGMTVREMEAARELFGDRLSDREITELYRRVAR